MIVMIYLRAASLRVHVSHLPPLRCQAASLIFVENSRRFMAAAPDGTVLKHHAMFGPEHLNKQHQVSHLLFAQVRRRAAQAYEPIPVEVGHHADLPLEGVEKDQFPIIGT
jgi:hypothetical protein